MTNLRSKHFQQIEEIYRDIESLSKLCKLPGIKRKISLLWNYAADNKKLTSHINFVVNRLNQIINFSFNSSLKEKLMKLYDKLIKLLPSDLQLELPLDVKVTKPIKKDRRTSKIMEQLSYMWKQFTLSDVSFLPQIGISAWEKSLVYKKYC